MKRILVIISLSFFLSKCSRTVYCNNQDVTPVFIGFSFSDLDTLIIRKFAEGSNFSNLLDTVIILSDSSVLKSMSSNDTTILVLNDIDGNQKYISPDYDWQIYIPTRGRIISFSNFVSPQTTEKCVLGGDLCPGCADPINSFVQDGQQTVPKYETKLFYGGYFAYIQR